MACECEGFYRQESGNAFELPRKRPKSFAAWCPAATTTLAATSTRVQISCLTAFRTLKTMDIAQL
jgi:hypothetical protein